MYYILLDNDNPPASTADLRARGVFMGKTMVSKWRFLPLLVPCNLYVICLDGRVLHSVYSVAPRNLSDLC